jgi:hypothetical protein
MRLLIIVVVVAIGFIVKAAMFSTSTVTVAAPAAATMSPHEIHLNYEAMKSLAVHDSTNAN